MLFQLFTSRPANPTIDALYGAIVAQARLPTFYLTYEVPDTVEGRFDMIVLHLVLVLRRLARQPQLNQGLGQAVFDHFCRDMDHNLREMGVGDLSVPKEMRRVAEAFYGRAGAYEQALASGDDLPLAAALAKNVFAEPAASPPSTRALRLAAYVLEAERLQDHSEGDFAASGRVNFPDPDKIQTTAAA
jgi:cytochrome b pre-mRNA-processing protein 3